MKLHLPSKLRQAVLACMTAMVGITTTCATGALVAGALIVSQTQAADITGELYWNGARDNNYGGENTIKGPDGRLIINAFKTLPDGSETNQPKEVNAGNSNGDSYKLGTLTVEAGGQLWLNFAANNEASGTTPSKRVEGSLTLSGVEPEPENRNWLEDATVVIYHGSYNFQDIVKTDGYVSIYSQRAGSQAFTNLSSTSSDDVLEFMPSELQGRDISYILNYNDKKTEGFQAFDGTLIINNPMNDGYPADNPWEMVRLEITDQHVVGQNTKYVINGTQTALYLKTSLSIPTVQSVDGIIRSCTSGSQVFHHIGTLQVLGAGDTASFWMDGGSVSWSIDNIEGEGDVRFHIGSEGFKPTIIHFNEDNPDFSGMVYIGDIVRRGNTQPTEEFGIYQDYFQINASRALEKAHFNLIGDWETYTRIYEEGNKVLDNDLDPVRENFAVAALNASDVYIGTLTGSSRSVIISGTAPTYGSATDPSTAELPLNSAGTSTLHIGSAAEPTDSAYVFEGTIMRNVNITKDGVGTQVLYTLENDPTRQIVVERGELKLGSVGDFRRIIVNKGARAEVGLDVNSEVNKWGVHDKFTYFIAEDNGIDVSDVTKVQGNVVLSDKIYGREYAGDWKEDSIVVTYLDTKNYKGDSITLVDADLAVFNPLTGRAADLSSIKTITINESSSLVSASPVHHNSLLADPAITVNSDINMAGYLNFMAYGSLAPSIVTGDLRFISYNTTYTGAIKMVPLVDDSGNTVSSTMNATIYKDGFGQVTLSGDMSSYGGSLSISDGTLTLSGSNGVGKAFSFVSVPVRGKVVLEVTDGAVMTMDKFRTSTNSINARSHCLVDVNVEAGSTMSIMAANTKLPEDPNDKYAASTNATFLVASGTHSTYNIDGTLNMLRASYLTSTDYDVLYADAKTGSKVGKKEININDGGVFNAKGIWLQSYWTDEATTVTLNIKSGGTLNLGEDGLGHVALNQLGEMHNRNVDNLVVSFGDGATLGILSDAVSWSTERDIVLNGALTVNTQGYVASEASTANGHAKTILLGMVMGEGSLIKDGAGTLAVGGQSTLGDLLVKNGYLTVNTSNTKYGIDITNVKTETNGALLFDLTHETIVGQTGPAVGQMFANVVGTVDGTLNVTVRAESSAAAEGKTYCIFTGDAPRAEMVNLVAMVDDGWYAKYELGKEGDIADDSFHGYVTITYDANKVLGNDKVLTWATSAGDSNFWGNSTETNWHDDTSSATRRFTNGSSVVFSEAGETVTLLGDVQVAGHGEQAAMTVSTTGYEFTGTGSIQGGADQLVIGKNVHVTFSNSGQVNFGGGAVLGEGSTLRLEYLTDTSSNWNAKVTGDGTLEIATGGVHSYVLDHVMGDSVGTISLHNNTTLELIGDFYDEEAAKLAKAEKVVINDGSRLHIETGILTVELFDAGDKLYIAGKGTLTDEDETSAALSSSFSNAVILADLILSEDATVYVNDNGLYAMGAYNSKGHTLTVAGFGKFELGSVDSAAQAGDIVVKQFSNLGLNIQDADKNKFANNITLEDSADVRVYTDVVLTGGLNVTTQNGIRVYDSVLTIDSAVKGTEASFINLNTYGDAVCVLATDNSTFEGTWELDSESTLKLDSALAAQKATIAGPEPWVDADGNITGIPTHGTLQLGATKTGKHVIAGMDDYLDVVSADGSAKTLELVGSEVYTSMGILDTNISIIQNGRGAQYFTESDVFAPGYAGDITVKNGLLQFYYEPETYGTITITSDDAVLGFGSSDAAGHFNARDLCVTTDQTLLITESGAALNANLKPMAGGQITLGADKSGKNGYWTQEGGLSLLGQSMILDTADKAKLTINLSPFLKAGDTVELFTDVETLMIDGQKIDFKSTLNSLDSYFDCDDINLARTQLELTAEGTLRIKLINDSDGLYYQYAGGDNGEWNNSDANWARKDDLDGSYVYSVSAAYFTKDTDATVLVTDNVVAREMAVKEGSYEFQLTDGNDVTIAGRYYEMDGGKATFVLNSADTVDSDGNPLTEGATLSVGSGFGDIDNTVVMNGDGSTANRLILGGTTSLSGDARFENVDLFLNGDKSRLNLGSTTDTVLQSLSGDAATITADGGKLTITNEKDSEVFVGKFLAASEDTAAGANTLHIMNKGAEQIFSNVTTDSSWNLVNEGKLTFTPTAGSTLNSLTLGESSVTNLTIDTDSNQMLGLTSLYVEEGAQITLNSMGLAPIMSGDDTPGQSYAVLGSFEEESLKLGDSGLLRDIELGSGTAFLMIDRSKPVTLEAVLNDAGYYDVVLKATVDDSNKFAPYAEGEPNASAGAEMLWTKETMAYIAKEPKGDLAKAFNEMATMVTSAKPDAAKVSEALAAVAGSSTAVLGSAFSADVERQLKAIRNRTTTMGVSQAEVNENMPYYNAWINAEGNHRELDSDGLAAGYTHDSWGGTVGFDVDVTPKVTMGLALTAMYGDIESDAADKAEGSLDTMYLSAFARYASNAWVHTFVATVGRADVTLDRTVNVGGYTYETKGETDGMAFGFMYEVGRVFAANEEGSACWQPVFNVALRNSSISGYEEKGSDAGLSVGDQDFTTITFGAGVRWQSIVGENLYNRASIFEARALAKFDAGDTEAETSNALLNGSANAYKVQGAEVGAAGLELGAGLTIPVGAGGSAIFFDASAELRSGYTNINGTVGYRVNF